MNPDLQQAIEGDDVEKLYDLIRQQENLLNCTSGDSFPHTLLHEAANRGKTKVAMEIAILKPSYARKLNREGHSPMHLALLNKHVSTARALMTLDPELIRVRGRGGITPLHIIAGEKYDREDTEDRVRVNKELLELLAEFLVNCKSSIEDLTNQYETAVHVAVKKHNIKAFKVLFGWLKRVNLTEILNWKDQEGKTFLQIADTPQLRNEIRDLLNGKPTALDTLVELAEGLYRKVCRGIPPTVCRGIPPTPKLLLSEFLSKELTAFEKFTSLIRLEDESARTITIGVATLIATATYQAALTPPKGYWQDNSSNTPANSTVVTANSTGIAVEKPHQAGDFILTGKDLHDFTVLNTLVFFTSVATIWISAVPLLPHTIAVHSLIIFFCFAYAYTVTAGYPKSDEATITSFVRVFMTLLLVVIVGPYILWLKYYCGRPQIDVKGRSVGNFLKL